MLSMSVDIQPLQQIVELDPIRSIESSTLCYHISISDGTDMKCIMVPTNFHNLATIRWLQKGSIIHVKSWISSPIGASI